MDCSDPAGGEVFIVSLNWLGPVKTAIKSGPVSVVVHAVREKIQDDCIVGEREEK